jgi:hypothetical protein
MMQARRVALDTTRHHVDILFGGRSGGPTPAVFCYGSSVKLVDEGKGPKLAKRVFWIALIAGGVCAALVFTENRF